MTYSSLYKIVCGFTRDYDVIKNKLQFIETYDKTCLEAALHGINHLVLGEWGNNTPCQVVLITDGNAGVGPMSLKHSLSSFNKREATNAFPLPFQFPGKLHVVCLNSMEDVSFQNSRLLYQKLVDIAGFDGTVWVPENNLTESSVTVMFQKLSEEIFTFYTGTLKCGHLESKIILSPTPVPYTKVADFETYTASLSSTIEVCGFISVADVSSPMAISRHLILPASSSSGTSLMSQQIKLEPSEGAADTEDTGNDEGKTPSFCVLLHGALKVENMAALVQLGDNWFGFVYSWADSKKKSNLMLTILNPGADSVPWLGNFNCLGCYDASLGTEQQASTIPVRPVEKRSYSQNAVVWIKQVGLQSDIQKILRHARKMPEKTQQFYKELNRLRRAAISLGFLELLDGLAFIFERECNLLPGSSHPDCAIQLTHAAEVLKKTQTRDIKYTIVPMQTNYSSSQ